MRNFVFPLAGALLLVLSAGCGAKGDDPSGGAPADDGGASEGGGETLDGGLEAGADAISEASLEAATDAGPDATAGGDGAPDASDGGGEAACVDSDDDGVCNDADTCPGWDDELDEDGDAVPNGCDICEGDDASGDPDSDKICDDLDACPGFDDAIDVDADGIPDGCDPCRGNNAAGDADADKVCDDLDACPGSDDAVDVDADGIADGCDLCEGDNATGDADADGICDDLDTCDTGADADGDAICDDVDPCVGAELFVETFEGAAHGFTLNTTSASSTATGENFWTVNAAYTGGTGTGLCPGDSATYSFPDTPSQPAAISGAPTSAYLHTLSHFATKNGLYESTFTPPIGCFTPENVFAQMTNDIDTSALDTVSLSFWYAVGGWAGAIEGEVWYSVDAGQTWAKLDSPRSSYHDQPGWTEARATIPELAGHATLRLGFRFAIGSTFAANDPGFSIDDVRICGASTE